MSQEELARTAGISVSMVSRLEAGEREPTLSLLRKLGLALGAPAILLMTAALASDESAMDAETREMVEKLLDIACNSISRAKPSLR